MPPRKQPPRIAAPEKGTPGDCGPPAPHPGPGLWKAAFLLSLAAYGNVSAAARAVGIDRRTAQKARKEDPAFDEAWAEALEDAADALEEEARRRAVHGVARDRGVYYKGELLATETVVEYSDVLLIFLLKACRPERFRERFDLRHRLPTGPEHGFDLDRLSDEDLADLERLSKKALPALPGAD